MPCKLVAFLSVMLADDWGVGDNYSDFMACLVYYEIIMAKLDKLIK